MSTSHSAFGHFLSLTSTGLMHAATNCELIIESILLFLEDEYLPSSLAFPIFLSPFMHSCLTLRKGFIIEFPCSTEHCKDSSSFHIVQL